MQEDGTPDPVGAQYEENLRHKLSRDTCWNEEADR